ncbi:hypothetical protein PFISCL1PPCAC_14593, partial [Pristionchus fissidentatus]
DVNLHPNYSTIAAICAAAVVGGHAIIVCLVCIHKIVQVIHNRAIEIRVRRLQIQLFRALIMQFTIPFLFSFLPFTIIIIFPLTGVKSGQLGNICALFASLYPVLDPLVIIISVTRFRSTIVEMGCFLIGRTAARNEKKAIERTKEYKSIFITKASWTL